MAIAVGVLGGWTGVAVAAPTGAVAVAVGSAHACAVRADDATVACWGATSGEIPAGRYGAVAAAGRQTCAIREADAGVACWGDSYWGLTPPDGAFRSIVGGGEQFCGVHADATLQCWGGDPWSGLTDVPAGAFRSVSVGDTHACAVREDHTVACWGFDDYGMSTPPAGTFDAVAAGTSHTCGLGVGGQVACWGADWMLSPPADPASAVSAGAQFSCVVRTADGAPVCWGADVGAPKQAPAVALDSLATGARDTCGIRRVTRGVVCWGDAALDVPADLATGAAPDPDPEPQPTAHELVRELVAALGPLPRGIAAMLTLKVERVLDRYAGSHDEAACRSLARLIDQLRVLTGRRLPDTEALRDSLARIRTFIGCGAG